MNTHISTVETDLIDAPVVEIECMICLKQSPHHVGYIGSRCECCNSYYSLDEPGQIFKLRREFLGLTRRQMADLLGLASITITKYENTGPSVIASTKSRGLVRAHNSKTTNRKTR